MTVDPERVARLEERMGRAEADVTELRRTYVSTELFESRMETVDLKLTGIGSALDDIKTSLTARRTLLRGNLLFPLIVSLFSGTAIGLVSFFLTH